VPGGPGLDIDEFRSATQSLLAAHARFREKARYLGISTALGVPIGALTSRIIANVSLLPLDDFISKNKHVICYRRYVDDLAIVAAAADLPNDHDGVLAQMFPLDPSGENQPLALNCRLLERPGSEFHLQSSKTTIHRL